MDILVTYDIADTDGPGSIRLRRIADVCQRYGERVQLSVFECRVAPDGYIRLLGELEDAINPRLDSVVVYRFVGEIQAARTTFGRARSRELGEPWLV
ncbi:MAG: CRISPR-associated endonuclease Cas2 [bacterium]|nr:CRISPR-associated endonuclease Cas2 [bacterium]